MKAFVLQMFFLAGNLTPPPALTYYNTLTECRAAITAWESRAVKAYPGYEVEKTETILNGRRDVTYPVVLVGHYAAICLPSSDLPDKPWVHNSP